MDHSTIKLHAELEARHWWFVARRALLCALIAEVVPPGRGMRIVDVGCGTGANTAALNTDYHAIGIDMCPEAIQFARTAFPGVTYLLRKAPEDVEDLVSRAAMILMTDVLEHVADDFLLLSGVFATAVPGTYFLLTVPADMMCWGRHDEAHGHFRRYERERFERVWQGLPVKTLLLSYFNSRLYPVIRLLRSVNRWRGVSFGVAGTDLTMPPRFFNWLLTQIFAGERNRLLEVLRHGGGRAYRHGVSLIALLRREDGLAAPRIKPQDVAPDCVCLPRGNDALWRGDRCSPTGGLLCPGSRTSSGQ